jgi:hypothetical protein
MMNTLTPTRFAEYGLNDTVSLVAQNEDLASGSVGRILGKFAHPGYPAYAIIVPGNKFAVRELRPQKILLVDDFPATA